MNDKMKIIQGTMIGTFLNNALTQQQTNLDKTQINQITNNIAQQWQQLDINQQNANTQQGQLKLQQLIKDIPVSKEIILQGLTRLIPNIMF